MRLVLVEFFFYSSYCSSAVGKITLKQMDVQRSRRESGVSSKKRNQDHEGMDCAANPLWVFEQSLVSHLSDGLYAGVDEVGRGALAGPVYAAAVVLGGQAGDWNGIRDSKQMSRKKREEWYLKIHSGAVAVGVGLATVEEIDGLNILHASRLAMGRAIVKIRTDLAYVLVDGTYMPLYEQTKELHHPGADKVDGVTVIDGDAKCLSIAAASIVAKVERDRYMEELSALFPGYGLAAHVGYATPLHLEKLREMGPSACHRKSFAPVKHYQQVRLDI